MALHFEQSNAAIAAPKHQNMLTGNALGVGSMILWAAAFPAVEYLLDTWSTLALISVRMVLAVGFLLVLWAIVEGPHALLRARWGKGMVIGGIGFGLSMWLLIVAQKMTDPVTVAIFASVTPISATVMEIALDGRRLRPGFVLGLGATVLGGLVATSSGEMGEIGLGALAMLVSSFLFCWGSRGAVKHLPDVTNLGRTTIALAGGVPVLGGTFCILWALGFDGPPTTPIDAFQVLMMAFFAFAGLAVSHVLWMHSVSRLGVALASFHINAAPFYVMLIMMFVGAGWDWMQALGAAIVAMGVILAQR